MESTRELKQIFRKGLISLLSLRPATPCFQCLPIELELRLSILRIYQVGTAPKRSINAWISEIDFQPNYIVATAP